MVLFCNFILICSFSFFDIAYAKKENEPKERNTACVHFVHTTCQGTPLKPRLKLINEKSVSIRKDKKELFDKIEEARPLLRDEGDEKGRDTKIEIAGAHQK